MTPSQTPLVEDNIKLAHHIANKFYRTKSEYTTLDYDDYASAAMLGLMKAARTFVPERGKFSSYAGVVMTQEVFMTLRRDRQWRNKRVFIEDALPVGWDGQTLDEECCRMSLKLFTTDDLYDGSEEYLASIIKRRLMVVGPGSRRIIKAYLDGGGTNTGEDIARDTGFSQPHVAKVIRNFVGEVGKAYFGAGWVQGTRYNGGKRNEVRRATG